MPCRNTVTLAREDWAHVLPQPAAAALCADHLIALAVGCRQQIRWPAAPLTAEDAAIINARCEADNIGAAYWRNHRYRFNLNL